MATEILYQPHIPVSALTNRPLNGPLLRTMPNFVCSNCQTVLNNPMQAIQHFNGRCRNEVCGIIIKNEKNNSKLVIRKHA